MILRARACAGYHNFTHRIIMSDEAHFQSDDFVNRTAVYGMKVTHHRCIQGSAPSEAGETSQNSIGPFLFEYEDGTNSGEQYWALIKEKS